MKNLQRELARMFSEPKRRKPDPHRRDREIAKPLAAQHGIEIERCEDGGFNVWPPKALDTRPEWIDPFDGNHFCNDWTEARMLIERYAHDCASH